MKFFSFFSKIKCAISNLDPARDFPTHAHRNALAIHSAKLDAPSKR